MPRYRAPIPCTSHVEALAIDDHISLQRLPLSFRSPQHPAGDSQVFELSCSAYESVLLGAGLDGVAHRGSVSLELLDGLLGSWIHVLLFRRPLFCIVEALFREGSGRGRTEIFALSPQARNELFLLSILGGLGQADLRACYNPNLYALDASPYELASTRQSGSSKPSVDPIARLFSGLSLPLGIGLILLPLPLARRLASGSFAARAGWGALAPGCNQDHARQARHCSRLKLWLRPAILRAVAPPGVA